MSHDTPILPGLSPVDGRDLQARFDGGALSSDGGALLLREIERKMRISDVLASCLADRRDPARTQHSFASMIRARVMAIACGYRPGDAAPRDHERLADWTRGLAHLLRPDRGLDAKIGNSLPHVLPGTEKGSGENT